MKKTYQKPQILFASFELSQNIAAGCELISNYAQNSCEVYVNEPGWDGLAVLTQGSCNLTPPNTTDEVCYHPPADNNNVYSS